MLAIAENPRAVMGGNFPPVEIKRKTPKLSEAEEKRYAEVALRCAKLLSAALTVPKKSIIGKRISDTALSARRALFHYLRGIDCPVKLMAKIFELDRGQPGTDADAMLAWTVRNEWLERQMEAITDFLDKGLLIDGPEFAIRCQSEIEADRATANAIKAARNARRLLEASTPPKPKKTLTEAERLVAAGQAKRRAEERATAERILRAVIAKGEAPGASKEARNDAKKAVAALLEIATDAAKKRKKG